MEKHFCFRRTPKKEMAILAGHEPEVFPDHTRVTSKGFMKRMEHCHRLLRTLLIWQSVIFPYETGIAQTFKQVSSGTTSEIRSLTMFSGGGVMLSDNLLTLNNGVWQIDPEFRGKRPSLVFPLAPDDIWYTVDHETSTSSIYHRTEGSTLQIASPFANELTAIGFLHPDTGFFVSFADVMRYTPDGFETLKHAGRKNHIIRLFAASKDHFLALTKSGLLLEYHNGNYNELLPHERIRDFDLKKEGMGFFLGDSLIYRLLNGTIQPVLPNPAPRALLAIGTTDSVNGWLAGTGGQVYAFSGKKVIPISFDKKLTFRRLDVTPGNGVWIAGDRGALFYHGPADIPVFKTGSPGFTAHKVFHLGINLDNEYGIALADLTGDGKDDIYSVCIYYPNRLFVNALDEANGIYPEAGFHEEAMTRHASGITNPPSYSLPTELFLGVVIADVDNDGDQDIYLCSLNARNKLLLNNGNGFFRDVSYQSHRACDDLIRSNSAACADVDLDGDLDLFVTSEEASNRLFLNDGTGHFNDVTGDSGLETSGGGMCCAFSDFDHDGLPDLCVSFWNEPVKLYRNSTSGKRIRFTDFTHNTPLKDQVPAKRNAVSFADVNNDGWPDLFIAGRKTPSILLLNDQQGSFNHPPDGFFPDTLLLTNGSVFADFNLDGYQDLFLTNVGTNILYENQSGKGFQDATLRYGLHAAGYSTGCAVSDIDNDGDPDLYVGNYIQDNSTLYMNRIEERDAVTFSFRGTRSPRDGTGTKIWIYTRSKITGRDSLTGYQEVMSGGGYGSVNSKSVLFSADSGYIYFARIKFPVSADTMLTEGIVAGSRFYIKEGDGLKSIFTQVSRTLRNFFTNPEIRREIVKLVLVVLLLGAYLAITFHARKRIRLIRIISCSILFVIFAGLNELLLFHPNPWLFYIPPAVVVVGLLILHLVTGRIILKRITENEKILLREKIARDLHDDLASTLSTISIYTDTLSGLPDSTHDGSQKLTRKISELTHSAKQSITEIIWMTSPRNDTLQSLISRVTALISDMLGEAGIRPVIEVTTPEKPVPLPENIRQNLFLILKEGTHNILKHAQATEVHFRVNVTGNHCLIRLSDNGNVFLKP